nr:M6 family metalloprotease domain-containing protein [Candidatus Njordarchaeota archaeon]
MFSPWLEVDSRSLHHNFATQTRVRRTFEVGFLLIIVLLPTYYITNAHVAVDPLTKRTNSQSPSSELPPNGKVNQHFVNKATSPGMEMRKVIVLLAQLKDKTNSTSVADMNSLVFTKMRSYFEEVSYGKMTVTGNITDWIYIDNNTVDYGKNTGSGSKGVDDTDGDGIPDSWKLIRDAINWTDGFINFTQYDDVIVVHSGGDEAKTHIPDDIWSSSYSGLDMATNDNITISKAILIAESDPMGIFAHEFGHELGLPDLYNTSGGPEYVGPWDLMAMGAWLPSYQGTSPSHPTSWSKIKLGWISENKASTGRVIEKVIDPLEIQGNNLAALKIPITTDTYYLVEVRNKTGYDSYLPSTGVLILYINESRSSGEGIVTVKYSQNLYQATYTVEAGKNMFIDNERNINLTVLTAYAFSYKVSANLIRADTTAPIINVIEPVPWDWPTSRAARVSAVITDTGLNSSSVKNASVVYSSDGRKTWYRIQMIPNESDSFSAVIPPQNSSIVEYYVEAYDYAGNIAVAKNGNQAFMYGSVVQTVVVITVVFIVVFLTLIAIMYLRTTRKAHREERKATLELAPSVGLRINLK